MLPSELLRELTRVLESLNLTFAVTGSMASTAYSLPRVTHDIDVVVELPVEMIEAFVKSFPTDQYYCSEDAVRDAVRRRSQFNILHPSSGLKIDVIVAKDDSFDTTRLSRRRRLKTADAVESFFASPEDVIIKKLDFYKMGGSDKHLRDITGMLKVRGDEISHAYIEHWAKLFDVLDIWQEILAALGNERHSR